MTTQTRQQPTPHIQVGPPASTQRRRNGHRMPSWALKTTMAVSGAVWAAFVAIHLFGNVKVFQCPDAFNTYAAWLRSAFYPLLPKESVLWTMRVVLAAALVVHVAAAALLWARGRRARGPFRARIRGTRSWGAWLMPVTGIVLLAFIFGHVLDLTIGLAPIAPQDFTHPADGATDAYGNLVASFQRPLAAWSYVAVMLLLATHVAKGFTTMAVDLGVLGRRWRAAFLVVGALLAVAILLGNATIPVLVQLGVLA